jgi:hypothetical protein
VPPRIVTILARLKQDLAADLSPDAIRLACQDEKYTWRERLLNPVTTFYLFILQVLHGNTSCQHTVHFGQWNFTAGAYCAARKRLPLGVYHRLVGTVAERVRDSATAASTWRGHRVWLLDGSSFSMPDTPELQKAFGQPGGQKRGCGFPVAKFLGLFDVATGMLLRIAPAPLRSHEMSRAAAATTGLEPGDVVVGDRGFCSFAHIALLRARKLHGVFRAHQRQIIDFTPGRPPAPRGKGKGRPREATIRPHSRWVLSQGVRDQVVIWYKPKVKPRWMTKDEYATLPDEIAVRELRYKVHTPGYRVGEVTLVTTLLEASEYPASTLADLYFKRWQVEVFFRDLKITLKMDVVKCETLEGVLKELAVFALVYNLVRSVASAAATMRGVATERVSVIDAVRWLVGAEAGQDLSVILINPSRQGRFEPRVKKRRPKPYPLMTKPRAELRKEVLDKKDAA